MLITQIDYLTLNARELTRPMCPMCDARAAIACRSRVASVLCVSRLIDRLKPTNVVLSDVTVS